MKNINWSRVKIGVHVYAYKNEEFPYIEGQILKIHLCKNDTYVTIRVREPKGIFTMTVDSKTVFLEKERWQAYYNGIQLIKSEKLEQIEKAIEFVQKESNEYTGLIIESLCLLAEKYK